MAVLNVSASQTVWIGLFKDPWKWSDGSNSSFRFWRASQPSYLPNQDCVAAVFQDNGKWNKQSCSNQLNFVCHGGKFVLFIYKLYVFTMSAKLYYNFLFSITQDTTIYICPLITHFYIREIIFNTAIHNRQ